MEKEYKKILDTINYLVKAVSDCKQSGIDKSDFEKINKLLALLKKLKSRFSQARTLTIFDNNFMEEIYNFCEYFFDKYLVD